MVAEGQCKLYGIGRDLIVVVVAKVEVVMHSMASLILKM